MTCPRLASTIGNLLFYFGVFGALLTGIKISHPFYVETSFHRGTCNLSSVQYSIASCTCETCDNMDARYFCWKMSAYYTSSDNSTVAYTQINPNMYSTFDADAKQCFITFRKNGYFSCKSSENMGSVMSYARQKHFPDYHPSLMPYYQANGNYSDTFQFSQYFVNSTTTFDCFYSELYNQIILSKVIGVYYAAFTPICVLTTLIGLWIMKDYGQGWPMLFAKWFYEELIIGLLAIPYNVVSCIIYIIAMVVIHCFGGHVSWTWDRFLEEGGMFCLCVKYYRTGWCPQWCPRRFARDAEECEPPVDVAVQAPMSSQPMPDAILPDLPPSYSSFFKEAGPNEQCALPPYNELELEGLPPVYDVVVSSGAVYHDPEVVVRSQEQMVTETRSDVARRAPEQPRIEPRTDVLFQRSQNEMAVWRV